MSRTFTPLHQDKCAVCGSDTKPNSILVGDDVREAVAPDTSKQWNLCPKHQDLYDKGMVALIGREPEIVDGVINLDVNKSTLTDQGIMVEQTLLARVFRMPLPADEAGRAVPVLFVHPKVVEDFKVMYQKAREDLRDKKKRKRIGGEDIH